MRHTFRARHAFLNISTTIQRTAIAYIRFLTFYYISNNSTIYTKAAAPPTSAVGTICIVDTCDILSTCKKAFFDLQRSPTVAYMRASLHGDPSSNLLLQLNNAESCFDLSQELIGISKVLQLVATIQQIFFTDVHSGAVLLTLVV